MMSDWSFTGTHARFTNRPQHCLAWLLLLILTAHLLVTPAMQAAPLTQTPSCEVLLNSSFEQDSTGWQITKGQVSLRVPDPLNSNSGNNVMRLGNDAPPDLIGESEVRSPDIRLPRNAYSATLRFRIFRQLKPPNPIDDDWQKLLIEDASGNRQERLAKRENDGSWVAGIDNLLGYRDQSIIKVVFAVYNDGKAGLTSMYVDDVVIEACTPTPGPTSTLTATPTGTATVTPTVTPTGTPLPVTPCMAAVPANNICYNLIVNGGFEYNGDWRLGEDPIPPRYVRDQRHSGNQAILLGNPPGGPNVESYSSIRQVVTIPADATMAQLCFWRLYRTEDTLHSQRGGHNDRQEVIALGPKLEVLEILDRVNSNDSDWVRQGVSLNHYIGRTFKIYFNAYNNASPQHTWAYIDDVELFYCTAAPPPPPPTATTAPIVVLTPATETPTATSTATNTGIISASAAMNLPPPTLVLVTQEMVTVKPLVDAGGAIVQVVTPTSADPFVIPNEQQVATAAPAPVATPTPIARVVALPITNGWGTRLGTIAILVGILALIGIIVYVGREIWRLLWGRSNRDIY